MEKKLFDLTAPQKSIWLTEQYYSNTNINNICATLISAENLNFDILTKAINLVIQNSDNFSLHFVEKDGELKQYFKKIDYLNFETVELNTKDEIYNLEQTLLSKVLDIKKQLFEIKFFKIKKSNICGCLINIHHIITDAYGIGLLCQNVMSNYNALLKNETIEFNANFSYKQFMEAEKEYLGSKKFETDKQYWDEKFSTMPNIVSIPPRKKKNSSSSAAYRYSYILNSNKVSDLKEFCSKSKISIFNLFMGLLSVYLYKINDINDFVIGTPILNRSNFSEKNTLGMFINVVPVRFNINPEASIQNFLSTTATDSMGLLRHQKYSYQYILENLRKSNPSIPNLYNIVFSYQITKTTTDSSQNYTSRWVFNNHANNDIEIHIHDENETGTLEINYDYRNEKYTEQEISVLNQRLLHILEQFLNNSTTLIKDIEICTSDEKNKILTQFNNTQKNYPYNKTIIDFFEEQAKENPNKKAVIYKGKSLTYSQLDEKSNAIANYLLEKNISNKIIGVYLNKSIEYIISILGILKSNNAFMPISSNYPKDRIEYMIKNVHTPILISNSTLISNIESTVPLLDIEHFDYSNNEKISNIKISPKRLSYIIFTSGSTGLPKAVGVSHFALVNHILGIQSRFENTITEKDVCLSIANMSFDANIQEIFIPLSFGATLHLLEDDSIYNPELLANYISSEKITFTFIPPTLLDILYEKLCDYKEIKLSKLLVGVQSITNSTLNNYFKFNPKMKIHNGYGPTEATICCISCMYNKIDENSNYILPIGKPMDNCEAYILDNFDTILPPYAIGEICVSGNCLSDGYIKLPQKTKEKFVFIESLNKLVYKTGDLAYFTDDGNIKFVGRKDNQIKLHGFRIELDEINTVITKNKNIKSSYTILSNTNQICTFIVMKNKSNYTVDELKAYLKEKLPYYMIPANIIPTKQLPANKNGKVDRSKLLDQLNEIQKVDSTVLTPNTPTELELEKIIKDLLNIDSINFSNNLFEIGGDSLSAIKLCSAIKNKFKIELTVKNIFEAASLRSLAKIIDTNISNQNGIEKFLYSAKSDSYPLSSAQKRIYYTSTMANQNLGVYNISGGLDFSNIIDFDKIKSIFNTLIERHESFRTFFEIVDGNINQKILKHSKIQIKHISISKDDVEKYFKKFNTNLDLRKAPLLKAMVLYLDNNHTMIFIKMHHIISDGASMQILLDEFCKLYNNEELPKVKFTYRDFINYENYFKGSDQFIANKDFWLNEFKDEIPTLNLPTNFVRPSVFTHKGSTLSTIIDKNLTNAILEKCKKLQVTPYMFLLASYYILLYKYTGQNTFIVGSPMANRNISEFSNIIGMFVNTLPIKKTIHSSDMTFTTFLSEVKEKCLDCFVHQNYPFDELVKNLHLNRDVSRNPLFDTMFTYQSTRPTKLDLKDTTINYYTPDTHISKFDLSLEIIPQEENYVFNLEYCTSLFTKKFISNFADHYLELIKNILNKENTKICDLEILPTHEKNELLHDFNNTKVSYNKNDFIYKAIDRQCKKTPNYTAITFKNQHLTYKELLEKSNALANHLKKIGIGRNNIVGIMLPRSLEVLVAIIATLKTGASYIPIDPSFPESRIEYMLNNSNASILLTFDNLRKPNIKNLCVEFSNEAIYSNNTELEFEYNNKPEDPSYIIYTSGSTGNPKGVVLNHKALTNLTHYLNGYVRYLKYNYGNMAIASLTTISFDIFIFETLISLQKGLNVVMATENEQTMPDRLNKLLERNNVKAFQLTPSRMEILLNNIDLIPALKNISYITLAGEALSNKLLKSILSLGKIKVYNGYGPSETTVFSTFTDVTHQKNVNIGKPLDNTQIYILDQDNQICPINVPGELCICGDGVGIGYKNIAPTVKNNYTISPISKRPMYRTGDLAKFLPNGELYYLGRIDNQIKIRGLRIELDEIEKKILDFPHIKKAVILAQTDDNNRKYLIAYLTITDKISINKLREHLRKYLPKYMVPSYFEILDDFPYLPNGKVNKKALPLPKFKNTSQEIIPARNELDTKILHIFESLLNLSPISITDNFFELGGDSLLAINLQIELLKFTEEITYADIFLNPTVQELSDKINNLHNIAESISDTVDLLNCNAFLQKNDFTDNVSPKDIGNILLTGATGFLGAHLLYEFINTQSGNVYCLLRPEKGLTLENKLLNKLHFYFKNELDNLLNKRIFILNGDITEENLGLSQKDTNTVIEQVSTIVNCAAKVSHFGKYELYKKINVDGVNNLIQFCKEHQKVLYHTSTTSISGEKLNENSLDEFNLVKDVFTEKDFYINQSLENVYVKSKFEAEKNIIKEIQNGLDAYILRIGNLMGRYSDGHFQQNIEENAYINRIISFIRMKSIPQEFLNHKLEFTPIDYCANSIIKIITHTHNSRVFHLLNNNMILIKDLLNIFEKYYFKVVALSDTDFKIYIDSLIKNSNYNSLNGIISDFDKNGKLSYEKQILVNSELTNSYLKQMDFNWPEINEKYMIKFLNYLDSLYKF